MPRKVANLLANMLLLLQEKNTHYTTLPPSPQATPPYPHLSHTLTHTHTYTHVLRLLLLLLLMDQVIQTVGTLYTILSDYTGKPMSS